MKLTRQEMLQYLIRFYAILEERHSGHVFKQTGLKLVKENTKYPSKLNAGNFNLLPLNNKHQSFALRIAFKSYLYAALDFKTGSKQTQADIEAGLHGFVKLTFIGGPTIQQPDYKLKGLPVTLDDFSIAAKDLPFKLTFNAYVDADNLIALLETISNIEYVPPIVISPVVLIKKAAQVK
jgi:hypothetical protein